MTDRLTDPEDREEDRDVDRALRPRSLDVFVGQEAARQKLGIFLEAARQRGDALDHVLLAGPPGLGKTSLARIVATELGVGFHPTSGPVIERKGDLAAILTSLEPRDVLFIDEIHRLGRAVEEVLYPAMEDFEIDVVLGQGPSARTLRLDLPPFTLIGATTRTGLLSSPLLGRFGVVERLNYYERDELARIVIRSAGLLGLELRRTLRHHVARHEDRPAVPRLEFAFDHDLGAVLEEIRRLEAAVVDREGLADRPARMRRLVLHREPHAPARDVALDRGHRDVAVHARGAAHHRGRALRELVERLEVLEGEVFAGQLPVAVPAEQGGDGEGAERDL